MGPEIGLHNLEDSVGGNIGQSGGKCRNIGTRVESYCRGEWQGTVEVNREDCGGWVGEQFRGQGV